MDFLSFLGLKLRDAVAEAGRLEASPPGHLPPFHLGVLRNISVEPALPYVKWAIGAAGFVPAVYLAGYDSVLPETLDAGGSLYVPEPDLIWIALTLDLLAPKIQKDYLSLSGAEAVAEADRTLEFLASALQNIRKNTWAPVMLHNFLEPVFPPLGILEARAERSQTRAVRALNDGLLKIAAEAGGCHVADLNRIRAFLGHERFIDRRMAALAKAPYSGETWKCLAHEMYKFIAALRGRSRKCLVLDCDNTLWGGIVGEDGLAGIKLGQDYPGSCYLEFQRAVKSLRDRGALLALCSRNNEADVLEVLDRHPDMALRRDSFSAMKIDWRDKVSNLREIAEELNIGLDSLVFVDDSEAETELVRRMLPEVWTIWLDGKITEYAERLAGCGLFDSLAWSEEDRKRGDTVRAEVARKSEASAYSDVGEFLKSLKMSLEIFRVDEFSLPRAAQLAQRTNQFNLTTRRRTEGELAALKESGEGDVLCLRYRDRFGDMGLVGLAVLRYPEEEAAYIDEFLLSCRVLGRRVEDALLWACMEAAKRRGARTVRGDHLPTQKNSQTAEFFPARGFLKTMDLNPGARYEADAAAWRPSNLDCFEIETGFLEGA